MTYTSPELLPTAAKSFKHDDIPVACRPLEPDRESVQNPQSDPQSAAFELQLSRNRGLLYFIARRILNCAQEAEEAVKNCRLTASRNPPGFSSEGAFKSWLVRILIDEATLLLRRRQSNSTASSDAK